MAADLAERTIANIATAAPPSFDGQGWLVVLNLWVMTTGFCLLVMLAGKLAGDMWRCRFWDRLREGPQILRLIFLLLSTAGVLRFGGEAVGLWAWDPTDPAATLAALKLKRLLDPVSAMLAFSGFGIFFLAERQIMDHLRRRPPPVSLWPKVGTLKRPALLIVLCFVAAVGLVSTR